MNLQTLKQNKSLKELLEFGILNIDKPANCTSFDVSNFVREKLNLKKTSHFGTLDPQVTGVLPVALNRAVKLTGFFIGEDKEYKGIMRFHSEVSIEKVKEAIEKKFLGKIKQLPPVKSRVKRQLREREIKSFKILEKKGKDIEFECEVQGGTYIRKLVHDLGEHLGIGAHMLKLRRIRAGIFKEKESVTKEQFEKAVDEYKKGNEKLLREMIIPAEIVSEIYLAVSVNENSVKKLLTGKPIYQKNVQNKIRLDKGQIISVFNAGKFIGMYKIVDEKEIFAKPEFVMQPL